MATVIALWPERITHSSVTRYMPTELMYGQKPIMPVERTIASWMAIDWSNEMVNDNAIYHLAELDRTPITTSVAGKRIKAFKRRNEAEPNPGADSASSGEEEE